MKLKVLSSTVVLKKKKLKFLNALLSGMQARSTMESLVALTLPKRGCPGGPDGNVAQEHDYKAIKLYLRV